MNDGGIVTEEKVALTAVFVYSIQSDGNLTARTSSAYRIRHCGVRIVNRICFLDCRC
jgi:hypothetical protein